MVPTVPGLAVLPPTGVRAAIAVTIERLSEREPSDAASGQLLEALRAGRQRRHAEMTARSTHGRVQVTSDISAADSES
ncbi:hypothetical protein ACFU53_41035 [Streptomyces sp. NPDC057474]|uniref:hypothetical protein n=1 Tax=Streptomyces sp. NPDC057474 TaxID=3346144 RepID=UPI0036AF30E8